MFIHPVKEVLIDYSHFFLSILSILPLSSLFFLSHSLFHLFFNSECFHLFPKLITSVEINKDYPHKNRNYLLTTKESVGTHHHLCLQRFKSKAGRVEKLSGVQGECPMRGCWGGKAGWELIRRGVSYVISEGKHICFPFSVQSWGKGTREGVIPVLTLSVWGPSVAEIVFGAFPLLLSFH